MSVEPGLFEATEGRGPLAPPGALFVWGVDVSSQRVSIAVEGAAIRAVFTKSFTRPRSRAMGERMAHIFVDTFEFAEVMVQRYRPEQVAVEAPGMNPGSGGAEPVLEFATGVVVAALSRAVMVPVWMMPVARWKKHAVGHGHAKKDQVLEWARGEFGAQIEDEADASGVARAAKLIVWEGLCDDKDVKRGAMPRGA